MPLSSFANVKSEGYLGVSVSTNDENTLLASKVASGYTLVNLGEDNNTGKTYLGGSVVIEGQNGSAADLVIEKGNVNVTGNIIMNPQTAGGDVIQKFGSTWRNKMFGTSNKLTYQYRNALPLDSGDTGDEDKYWNTASTYEVA